MQMQSHILQTIGAMRNFKKIQTHGLRLIHSQFSEKTMSCFKYTHAIVCRMPASFETSALNTTGKINLEKAKKEHESYISSLRGIGLDVIELPPDENYPDCIFVEDTAVVCNGTALICRPGAESRQGEVDYMRNILSKELQIPIADIRDKKALLDGGDVLFTGKEFFVGLSSRTNEAGAAAVANAFPEFPCSPIKVENSLHLKSVITMAAPDVLCVSNSESSQASLKKIEQVATFRYQIITVPDPNAANVVFANGHVFYNAEFPETGMLLKSKMPHWDVKPICNEEKSRAAGSLTCSSILIRKPKIIKSIM